MRPWSFTDKYIHAEEKKKLEKRLVLLHTVSEKLQESRAACEATEERLAEASSENNELRSSVTSLGDNLAVQGSEIAKMKAEIAGLIAVHDETLGSKIQAEIEATRSVRNAGITGAGIGLLAGAVFRILFDRPAPRQDSE